MKEFKRKGFSVIDTILAIVLGVTLLGGGIFAYNKTFSSTSSTAEYEKYAVVIGAAERAKADNGGSYPQFAAGTALNAAGLIANHLGGATSAGDLSGWTYGCVGTTLTITSAAYSDTNIADILAAKIENNHPGWTATSASGVVASVLTGVACN